MGFLKGVVLATGILCSFAIQAQGFPNKPVRLIIAFTPGIAAGCVTGAAPRPAGAPLWPCANMPATNVAAAAATIAENPERVRRDTCIATPPERDTLSRRP